MQREKCGYCGAIISDDETAYVLSDAPACVKCFARLTSPRSSRVNKYALVGGVAVFAVAAVVLALSYLAHRIPEPAASIEDLETVPHAQAVEEMPKPAATISGGAWLKAGSHESHLLRGMQVLLGAREVSRADTEVAVVSMAEVCLIATAQARRLREGTQNARTAEIFETIENALLAAAKALADRLGEKGEGDHFTLDEMYIMVRGVNELSRLPKAAAVAVVDAYLSQGHGSMPALALTPEDIAADKIWPSLVNSLVIMRTTTDIDGKFQLSEVPPGQYYLYARSVSQAIAAEWLIPVEVRDSGVIRIDFDDSNVKTLIRSAN